MARRRRRVPIELQVRSVKKKKVREISKGNEVKIPIAKNPVQGTKPGMIR